MRALVTGATGFVGSHLVEALVRRGADVTALVRSPAKAAHLRRLGVRQVAGDLHTPAALRAAAQGQDAVFHVAGLVAAVDEAGFLHGNREGTRNLVEALGTDRPRFVLVSSMAAGGPALHGRPLTGAEPAAPVTAYGRSKLASEEIVRQGPLPWTIIRPPMVYGPRDTEVLKVFRIARWGVAPVFGDGTQQLSAVYGPDLAEALIAAATAERTVGRTYYACHQELVTSAGFVQAVGAALRPGARPLRVVTLPAVVARAALTLTGTAARLSGKATILTADKANEFFQPAWAGDPGPLYRDAGWQAATDLATGLGLTAQWYREQRWL